jgi:hypothetical protein
MKMKSDREVLEGVVELISQDGAWTKGELCRNSAGYATSLGSEDVVSWCLEGAIRHVAGYVIRFRPENRFQRQSLFDQVYRLDKLVLKCSPTCDVPRIALYEFNDALDTSQEDAILAVKTAIGTLE